MAMFDCISDSTTSFEEQQSARDGQQLPEASGCLAEVLSRTTLAAMIKRIAKSLFYY